MLMIYDYRVTVRHDDSPQQTDTFDHAIIADTNDHRSTVLRQSLEDVDGCVIVRATLLSVRSLTLHELGLLDRTTLKVRPIPGIRLTRRISQLAPGQRGLPASCRSASWSRWMTDSGMSTILICCFHANSARTMQWLRHHAEIEVASLRASFESCPAG